MKYRDAVYGESEISEPVVLELISSPEMQRLKGISQAGYFEPYFPGSHHTRFEHSVGDYLLLSRFGASLEERIAGLLHDVSHTAFSHAIDYALSEGSEKDQSFQDNCFGAFVRRSSIPSILEKHGLDPEYVIDERNFPLQENQLPDICADRIDYSLRGFLAYGMSDKETVGRILGRLKVIGGKWAFEDFASAREYAGLFKELNGRFFSGIETAVMFRRVGDYLKHALGKGYVSMNDLYFTDEAVIGMINAHLAKDKELGVLWKAMNDAEGYVSDPENYDIEVHCKSRIIDPPFLADGKLVRVSDADPEWKETVAEESKPKRHRIRFLS